MAAYGDAGGFEAWMLASGYSIPASPTPPTSDQLIERGSRWVDGEFALRFTGKPTGGITQERAWPRTGATAFGDPIDPNLIPDAVIQATYAAAYQEGLTPGLLATFKITDQAIKRQKVDVIEIEFQDAPDGGADTSLRLNAVEGLLAPLLKPNSTVLGAFLRTVGN